MELKGISLLCDGVDLHRRAEFLISVQTMTEFNFPSWELGGAGFLSSEDISAWGRREVSGVSPKPGGSCGVQEA